MNYLAIDLGLTNRKSVAIVFDDTHNPSGHAIQFKTTCDDLTTVVERHCVNVAIIEMCTCARWIWKHLCSLGVTVYVANTSAAAFRDAKQRHKSDLKDAERLKVLYQTGNLKTVHMLSEHAHRLRSLIEQRKRHVGHATSCKNALRTLCEVKGIKLSGGWDKHIPRQIAQCIDEVTSLVTADSEDQIWREQIAIEWESLQILQKRIKRFDTLINSLTRDHQSMAIVRSVPGIGLQVGAASIAAIDDPHRFQNKKQVSAYSGFTPRQQQSGNTHRPGSIDRQGWSTLRGLLMESVTSGIHIAKDPWFVRHYEHALRNSGKKIKAQVCVARKLFIRLWYMLKHQKNMGSTGRVGLKQAT